MLRLNEGYQVWVHNAFGNRKEEEDKKMGLEK